MISDHGCLAEAYLNQTAGCNWIARSTGEILCVYGDPTPVFGIKAEEMTGRRIVDVFGPDTAALWKDRFARALAGEHIRLRERRPDGAWMFVLFRIDMPGMNTLVGGAARFLKSWVAAEEALRNTVLSSIKAQEFERRTTATFLHDKVGQNLTALGLQLDLARMDVEAGLPDAAIRLASVQKLLESMMEEVRDFSYELNPNVVERAGLRAALDRYVERIHTRFAGVIRVNVDPNLGIDPKIASAMYSIAQEAIKNSLQHSSCSTIEIAVKSTRTGPALEVRDNGRGFDPADGGGQRGLGLLSMEQHAVQAGLCFKVRSSPGAGATVRAHLPDNG
jgi:signal transduction histidine kinase